MRIRTTGAAMAVEEICWKHRFDQTGDGERAASLSGYVEAVYEANPGLADLGPLVPEGTVIDMPELDAGKPVASPNRLWG